MRMRPRAGSTRGQPGRAGRSTEQRRCTGRSEPPWLVALPACPPPGRQAPMGLELRAPHRLLDTTAARSGPRSKRKWKREPETKIILPDQFFQNIYSI